MRERGAGWFEPATGSGGQRTGPVYPMMRKSHESQSWRRFQQKPSSSDHVSLPVTQKEWASFVDIPILVYAYNGESLPLYYRGEFRNGRPVFATTNAMIIIYWDGAHWLQVSREKLVSRRAPDNPLHRMIPPVGEAWDTAMGYKGDFAVYIHRDVLTDRERLAWDDRRHHQYTSRARRIITALALIATRIEGPEAVHWNMVFEEMNEIDFCKGRKVDSKKLADVKIK